jgi:hypothetical protein
MLNMETRMSNWKQPQPLDFVYGATSRYSFVNWQTGNDDSVYYNRLCCIKPFLNGLPLSLDTVIPRFP